MARSTSSEWTSSKMLSPCDSLGSLPVTAPAMGFMYRMLPSSNTTTMESALSSASDVNSVVSEGVTDGSSAEPIRPSFQAGRAVRYRRLAAWVVTGPVGDDCLQRLVHFEIER